MFIRTTFDISPDFIKPIWTGKAWKYAGQEYKSLRLLKTKSQYKLNESIANEMAKEIRAELDKEILEVLRNTHVS